MRERRIVGKGENQLLLGNMNSHCKRGLNEVKNWRLKVKLFPVNADVNRRLRNASLRCSPLPVPFFGVQAIDVDAGGPEAVGQAVQVGALDFERDQLMFFGIL
jgi:hypothetical protein